MTPMPRLASALRVSRPSQQTIRHFVAAPQLRAGHEGRKGDEHALNRDGLDVQSANSQKSREDRNAGTEDQGQSQAIEQKDQGNFNKKAKETTKAPGPVIGMNDERGGVCVQHEHVEMDES